MTPNSGGGWCWGEGSGISKKYGFGDLSLWKGATRIKNRNRGCAATRPSLYAGPADPGLRGVL